jgi:hypothetical protein
VEHNLLNHVRICVTLKNHKVFLHGLQLEAITKILCEPINTPVFENWLKKLVNYFLIIIFAIVYTKFIGLELLFSSMKVNFENN